MDYTQVGSSGLTVSRIGLGCNNFGSRIDETASKLVIDAAFDAGITLFDTADIYSNTQSECILGQALRGRRDRAVIATKFGLRGAGLPDHEVGASRAYVIKACEASLKRLGTEYIDIYLLHKPDGRTPVEETLCALDDLIRAGKIRYVGSSNFSAWQIADADHVARSIGRDRFVATQAEWNLLSRDIEREIVPACAHFGVGIIPYFPLASGMLTGKYQRNKDVPGESRLAHWSSFADVLSDENFAKVEKLTHFAEARGRTILDLAMAWLLNQSTVSSVIAGATRPEQVVQNIAALDWILSDADFAEIDALLAPPA